MSYYNLQPSSAVDLAFLNSAVTCADIEERDFPDWEEVLRDPARSPLERIRVQRQKMSDCQGQALAGGTESRVDYATNKMIQLSDIYAYNCTERMGGAGNVGRDRGTNILQGVRVLVEGIPGLGIKPGLPTEADWPYSTYEKSASRFEKRAREATMVSGCVTEQLPMPPFRTMLIALAARGTGHIGTKWPPRWQTINGRRYMANPPQGGGGHATFIVWAMEAKGKGNGWTLCVWNSHGKGYYLMSESCYTWHQKRNFAPYGARLLMPDKAKDRFVNWSTQSPWFE